MTDTTKLLGSRGPTHGSYNVGARIIQALKYVIRDAPNYENLTNPQKESLDLIATKMGRILTGDPNCLDHWDDIIGYAQLISNRIANPDIVE